MAGEGHKEAFPPTKLSNHSRLGKPTFAGDAVLILDRRLALQSDE